MRDASIANTSFQSTPVISDGRAVFGPPGPPLQHRFNPRPSFLTGEPKSKRVLASIRRFQTTPVISDGRAQASAVGQLKQVTFQSTPVISDGRAFRDNLKDCVMYRFNPRPSFLTGEPALDRCWNSVTAVSIHARHF